MMSISKPRILIVIGTLVLGGAEKHLLTILPHLLDCYDISIYTTSYQGTLAPAFLRQGIKVLGSNQEPIKKQNPISRIIRLGCRFIKMMMHLQKESYDAIHFFLPGAYLLGGSTAVLLRKNHLVMSRRSQNDYQKNYPFSAMLEKKLHRYMTVITANSKRVAEQLRAEGVTDSQLRLIYNGVVIPQDRAIQKTNYRSTFGLSSSTCVLTIIANLFFYKGHADLLHALALIKHQLPPDWQLLCVGRDAGELRNLMTLADSLELSPYIQWMGQRFDITELVTITDIGLLVSHEEGFSNAVLEFMVVGKPMVVTDVGGNAEAVLDGISGMVVPAKNIEQIAEAILKLAKDEVLRLSYGVAARQRAIEQFSVEQCVLKYHDLYEEVLKS